MSEQRYLVTARKYRPALFCEIVAQEHVTETLRNAIRLDRLAHAYLFSGPRGVGKTTAARILAKAINCTDRDPETAEPCRTCLSCRDFESGRSLNIIEIDAASNNKVEDVRELRETVRIPPQGSLKKVYIIDEVHMLSNAAFNALLKTLEEPPPYVLFIFATTEPHKVLPTILSRCQRFDFRRIPVVDIVGHLEDIGRWEGVTADEESLLLLARKGDGSLRDALSAFDQAIALCGTKLLYRSLADALRVVDIDLYFEATAHVATRSNAGMLRLVEHIVRDGLDLQEFLTGLAEHLRNLLVARSIGDVSLIEAATATRARYEKEGASFTESLLLRLFMIVDEAAATISQSAYPRLKLELALLKMASLTSALTLSEALKQLDRLEKLARDGKLAPDLFAPKPVPAPPPPSRHNSEHGSAATQPTPAPAPPPAKVISGQGPKDLFGHQPHPRLAGPMPAAEGSTAVATRPKALASKWPHFVEHVKNRRIQIGALLQHTAVLEETDGILRIGVPDDFHLRMLGSEEPFLLQRLGELLNTHPRGMEFIVKPDIAPTGRGEAPAVDPAAYLEKQRQKNPVIQAIFEQFGGEVVW